MISDNANEYLGEWTEQFDQIKQFSWVLLQSVPVWPVIKDTMNNISQLVDNFDVNENSAKVFAQYGFLKAYCTLQKLEEWKNNKDEKNGKPKIQQKDVG